MRENNIKLAFILETVTKEKKRMYKKLTALKLAIVWAYQSSHLLFSLGFIVAVIWGLIAIIEPYIFKLIIDHLTQSAELTLAEKLGLSLVGILIVYGTARVLQEIFWDINSLIRRLQNTRIERQVMHQLMKHISSLDLEYFEDPAYYNTLSRATSSLWRITEYFWQYNFLITESISVFVIIGALLTYDWRLVVFVALGAVPGIIIAARWSEILWSAFEQASPIFRHAQYYRSLLTEHPEAVKEIRTFQLNDHFLAKFRNLFNKFIRKQDESALKQLGWYAVLALVEGGLSILAAWFVIDSFIKGKATIGDVTFLWALLFQFAGHVRWMVRMIGDMNTHATFLTPLVDVLSFEQKIKEPEKPAKFPATINEGIVLKNVSFQYPRSKKPALKNVNLTVKPNESIALVGENGSGKTTLIKLLCRLYDTTKGEILIDRTNIKNFCLSELYDNIGIIFQDFMKYEALVKENIAFGRLGEIHSKKKIHQAAVKAGAWNFIKEFEKKYQSQLGKKLKQEGIELSVGQWQKIALARAFFRDAQILILDEPTAAVDAKAEYELFKKFRALTKNKITFLISHRFSTVRMADKIIVVDKGRIIEQGSHQELLRKNGTYAKLFMLQAKGYK